MQIIRYRPDIDGLRGIAILAVVFYHCNFPLFRGGFIGVDIFFVISGFLITSIIFKEREQGSFTIRSFYLRRARRILPAFFSMTLAVCAAALVTFPPDDLFRLADMMANALVFLSNFALIGQTAYFAPSAHENPLLHTWSLSVEEQFYLVWPWLLVFALKRGPRAAAFWMSGLFAASLAYSELTLLRDPRLSFYMFPSRAFELLAGAALAAGFVPACRSRVLAELAASAGAVLILASLATLDGRQRFPGFSALAPSLGAALIVHANASRPVWTRKALSLPPLVFTGLISYSLYLWHWPLLALAGYSLSRPLTPHEAAPVAAVAVLVSILSWRFVERPFRSPLIYETALKGRRALLAFGVPAATLAALCVAVAATHGVPWRAPASVMALEQLNQRYVKSGGEQNFCLSTEDPGLTPRACVFGAAPERGHYDVALWGDSHAAHYLPALAQLAAEDGLTGVAAMLARCPPLLGVHLGPAIEKDDECVRANDETLRLIESLSGLKLVVVASRWAFYAEANRFSPDPPIYLYDAADASLNLENTRRAFADGLRRTLARLNATGASLLLVAPGPEFPHAVLPCVARRQMLGIGVTPCLQTSRAEIEQRDAFVNRVLAEAAGAYPAARVISAMERFCDGEVCRASDGAGVLWFHDTNHLTLAGAMRAANALRPGLETTGAILAAGKRLPQGGKGGDQ
jgi:peptidoglycan/LPS O-acetylase OafA/YrhL